MNPSLKILFESTKPLIDDFEKTILPVMKRDNYFVTKELENKGVSPEEYCKYLIQNLVRILIHNFNREVIFSALWNNAIKVDEDPIQIVKRLHNNYELNEEELHRITDNVLGIPGVLSYLYSSFDYVLIEKEGTLDISRAYAADLEQREKDSGGGKKKDPLQQRMFKIAWLEYFQKSDLGIRGKGKLAKKYLNFLLDEIKKDDWDMETKKIEQNYRKFQERFYKQVKKYFPNGNYYTKKENRFMAIRKANSDLKYFPENALDKLLPAIDEAYPRQ